MYVVDYVVVIALDEEFQSALGPLQESLGVRLSIQPEGPLVTGRAVIPFAHRGTTHEELLVAICPGQMGHAAIAAVLPDVLDRYRPRDIILIGLSGSFDPENLMLGDVLVPMKVFGYAEAKVVQFRGKNVWTFRTLGDRATSHARAQIRAIDSDAILSREWKEQCLKSAELTEPDKRITSRLGISVHETPQIHAHHNDSLASGNAVVASKIFAKELQQKVDITLRAVDMEAGGLFEAMDKTDWPSRVLVLRGISDYADNKKSKLEKNFKNGWRIYAMQNAVRLAAMLIRQRLKWEPRRTSASAPFSLSLEPHTDSYTLCADVHINNSGADAQNLAFTRFLDRTDGAPGFCMTIEDTRAVQSQRMTMLVRETGAPYREIRYYTGPTGQIELTREASDSPFLFDLFVSSPTSGTAFRVRLTDEFGRTMVREFPANCKQETGYGM
jgi:nucleoside phosphorylase